MKTVGHGVLFSFILHTYRCGGLTNVNGYFTLQQDQVLTESSSPGCCTGLRMLLPGTEDLHG